MAYKPFDLTGKVALVTGGNGGIGLGMADAMAQAGADLVIWGTNEAKNAAAEAQLKAHGRKVLTQKIDVADEAAVKAGMAEAVAKMGRVDNVVANAGVGGGSPSFPEFSTETYRRVLAVNLDGVFFTFREACRKHMVERAGSGRQGRRLAWSSPPRSRPSTGRARNEAYASTKGAVISMIRGHRRGARPLRRARANADPARAGSPPT